MELRLESRRSIRTYGCGKVDGIGENTACVLNVFKWQKNVPYRDCYAPAHPP